MVIEVGIRPADLLRIRRSDVHWTAQTLRWPASAKGQGAPARTVPLTAGGLQALRAFDASIALDPTQTEPYLALVSLKGVAVDDPRVGAMETLARRKAKLGHDHPDTLQSMNDLANGYGKDGRLADALKLHEETLARRKAKLGHAHPDTLWSMYNIARCHALFVPKAADKGKEAELAIEWLQKAVAAGYNNIAQIKADADTDLDALRGREDFKKLVADLEAKLSKDNKQDRR